MKPVTTAVALISIISCSEKTTKFKSLIVRSSSMKSRPVEFGILSYALAEQQKVYKHMFTYVYIYIFT